jgi:ubiquinone/menaquinone biosynthesis C-methylase UbiE
MAGFHTHAGTAAPTTKGLVIHWAGLYDALFGRILHSSEAKIVELAQIKPGDKVLDLGCGPGSLSRTAKARVGQSGEVHGLDASPEMIEQARRKAERTGANVNFQLGVIEALPYPDGTFDVVMSRLVLHHLPDDLKSKGFAEMRRVLKPGGYCLIVDFEGPTNHVFQAIAKHHAMLQTNVKNYIPMMAEAGFDEIENGPTGRHLLSFVRGRA